MVQVPFVGKVAREIVAPLARLPITEPEGVFTSWSPVMACNLTGIVDGTEEGISLGLLSPSPVGAALGSRLGFGLGDKLVETNGLSVGPLLGVRLVDGEYDEVPVGLDVGCNVGVALGCKLNDGTELGSELGESVGLLLVHKHADPPSAS
jgi:hypothetical protein